MKSEPPQIVVVLAAGLGSRLSSTTLSPKPLQPVAGPPLILRVLSCFAQAGVTEAVVVLGYAGETVKAGIEQGHPRLPVQYVVNPRYELGNGLSVLAARSVVGNRPFFLSMADHIFDTSLITGLASAPLPGQGLVLAVDYKLDEIFDMDDATKVRITDGRIVEIHKELQTFDAVDTGLFACTPTLFEAIEKVSSAHPEGDCSLSDGVKALAANGKALVHDIGAGHWQDVDTEEAKRHAEQLFSTKL